MEGGAVDVEERGAVEADGFGAVGRAGGEDFLFEQVVRLRGLGGVVRASLGCGYVS